jgi:hypothetical protein
MNIFSALFTYYINLDQQGDTEFYVHLDDDRQAILTTISWSLGEEKAQCRWIGYNDGTSEKHAELEIKKVIWGKILKREEHNSIMKSWKINNQLKISTKKEKPELFKFIEELGFDHQSTIEYIIAHGTLSTKAYADKEHIETMVHLLKNAKRVNGKNLKSVIHKIISLC